MTHPAGQLQAALLAPLLLLAAAGLVLLAVDGLAAGFRLMGEGGEGGVAALVGALNNGLLAGLAGALGVRFGRGYLRPGRDCRPLLATWGWALRWTVVAALVLEGVRELCVPGPLILPGSLYLPLLLWGAAALLALRRRRPANPSLRSDGEPAA